MKKLTLLACLAASAALVSCGGNSGSAAPAAAKMENLFVTEQRLTYANSRPDHNYYTTTFTFEELELYSDKTYKLTVSACTFSALVLPEEGQAASGNARDQSFMSYYGSFTYEVDDLDDKLWIITFGEVTRISGFRYGSILDTNGIIDTDNWSEDMKKVWFDAEYDIDATGTKTEKPGTHKEYDTGAAYVAAHQVEFKGDKNAPIYASLETGRLDWINISAKK